MLIANRNIYLGVALAALLWGCGSGSQPDARALKAHQAASAHKQMRPDDGSRNLVSAVAVNKVASMPLQVKFALKARPDVGQPLDVDLVIVPLSGSVDRLSGKIEASDGLTVEDGAVIAPLDRPVEGTAIHHAIRVLPHRDGIFTFNAVLTVDSAGQTLTESYGMPLIAGAGIPDLPAKPTVGTPTTTASAH
jgi:hypothetical protein